MRILEGELLDRYLVRHHTADKVISKWKHLVRTSNWRTPNELRATVSRVSILGGRRVVFDLGGNNYRIVAEIDYARQQLAIRFIGTHAEYDEIDAEEI